MYYMKTIEYTIFKKVIVDLLSVVYLTQQIRSLHVFEGIIVVMGHSHYGPVVMVHMVVIMVHLGKSLWSTWVSRYGPPKKSLWSTIRNIRNNVEMGSKL